RFYVHERVYDDFSKRFSAAMKAVKMGSGLDPGVELGPMVSQRAVRDIQHLVEDAVGKGAEVLAGGAPSSGRGYFYPATVLGNVPAAADLLKHEIFGPV